MVIAISFSPSAKLVMSVRSTSTFLPSSANFSATASERSGTISPSTTGSAAVCTKNIALLNAPPFSRVSLKNIYWSYLRPIPPSIIMSTSACSAILASTSL